jgi:hypothetical protein
MEVLHYARFSGRIPRIKCESFVLSRGLLKRLGYVSNFLYPFASLYGYHHYFNIKFAHGDGAVYLYFFNSESICKTRILLINQKYYEL